MKMSDEPGCYDDEYGQWLRVTAPQVREYCGRSMPGKTRRPLEYHPFAGTAEQTHGWWTTSEAIRFIRENKARPFFCNIGFYNPHPPLMPPQDMLDLYAGRPLKPRVWRAGELDTLPALYKRCHLQSYSAISEAEWTEYRRFFYAMVSDVDRNMGRLIATTASSTRASQLLGLRRAVRMPTARSRAQLRCSTRSARLSAT